MVQAAVRLFQILYDTYDSGSFDPGELRYESISAQTDISLQNGAVMMRPRIQSGSTMLAEPRWFYDEDDTDPGNPKRTLVINLIGVTSDSILAKEGIATVQMRLIEDPDPYQKIDGSGDVVIYYTPDPRHDYSVAWRNYFKNTLEMTEGPANTYTLSGVDTLVVKKYIVKIESI